MNRRCRMAFERAGLTVALIAALTSAGCSDGRPQRVPIRGQVRIDGKPLAKGCIMFVRAGARPASGMLDAQGRFELTCFEPGDGAIPGSYQVKVTAAEPVGETSMRWHTPKEYADEKTSGIALEITEPQDDLIIELSWKGGQPFVEEL
jgi:hypothetical protein